jgi:hypothetical protein
MRIMSQKGFPNRVRNVAYVKRLESGSDARQAHRSMDDRFWRPGSGQRTSEMLAAAVPTSIDLTMAVFLIFVANSGSTAVSHYAEYGLLRNDGQQKGGDRTVTSKLAPT